MNITIDHYRIKQNTAHDNYSVSETKWDIIGTDQFGVAWKYVPYARSWVEYRGSDCSRSFADGEYNEAHLADAKLDMLNKLGPVTIEVEE